MADNRHARKKTFINRRIQGRILLRIAAYWVVYHFVLWIGLFVFRYAQYRAAITSGGEAVPFRELYRQFCVDFYPLIVCAAVILPAFMIDFAKLTHRIAGPLIRFREALRQLKSGKRVEQVELRKGDLLTELQSEFNEFLAYYNGRLGDIQNNTDQPAVDEADRIGELVTAELNADESPDLEPVAVDAEWHPTAH